MSGMLEKLVMLVVDDMEVNRRALRSIFEKEYEVLEAADGGEALGILEKRQVDVVILDIVMPGLDGVGLLGRMRADHALRDIPVLVKTAVDETMEAMMLERGADDFILSPCEPMVVKYRVRNLVQRYLYRKAVHRQEFLEDQRKRQAQEAYVRQLSEEIKKEGQALLDCCGETEADGQNIIRTRIARILVLADRIGESAASHGGMNPLPVTTARGNSHGEKRTLDCLRVFLLDDNELTRSYHLSMLARLGVQCDCAANGTDALHELRRAYLTTGSYDVCFINWNMPDVTGIVREIRSASFGSALFVVGTTGARESEEAEMISSGVDYILEKPVYQAALYRFLTDICGGILQKKRSADA